MVKSLFPPGPVVDPSLQTSASIHHGCMNLPQELVDYIMEMLHDDTRSLKACSLTCKTMLASTRHLIHYTLYLTPQNNQSVLTREEQSRYQGQEGRLDVQLRFLSYVGERGFLRYTQQVHIRGFDPFTPGTLLPHLHHFQSLDRVHTLMIDHYDTALWENYLTTCFVHFYPTLTSLTLRRPIGHYRFVFKFVLQFPNLENLCLEWPTSNYLAWGVTTPAVVYQFPPLRGHLRLVGLGGNVQWPMDFARELGGGINFRSVEIEEPSASYPQDILNACGGTLESLTLVPRRFGARRFFMAK